jgi:hypothetical protein
MKDTIKITGDMETDMRVLLSHYLTPSDVDYYMDNEINNRAIRTHGQTTKTGANQRPHRRTTADAIIEGSVPAIL